jgi:hypothetical protein
MLKKDSNDTSNSPPENLHIASTPWVPHVMKRVHSFCINFRWLLLGKRQESICIIVLLYIAMDASYLPFCVRNIYCV